MTSPSLSSLPTELCMILISSLSNDVRTLSRLSVTSKYFNSLTTPYLYRTYSSLVEDPESSNQLFLRTIIRRPDLALHTRRVILQSFESSQAPYAIQGRHEVSDEDSSLFKTAARYFCCSREASVFYKTWLGELETPSEDARIALLLVLMPNMEFLFFEENYKPIMVLEVLSLAGVTPRAMSELDGAHTRRLRSDSRIPSPSPEMVDNLRKSFSSLRSIQTVSRESKYGYLGFKDLLPLFGLPSLTSLEIGLANADWGNSIDIVEDAASSSIQRLILMYSAMNRRAIDITISKCKGLKEFCYVYGRIHMYGLHFTPRELGRLLVQHKNTLEILEVNFDDDWQKVGWERLLYENLYFDQSLKELGKLRILKCSQQALLGLLHQVPEYVFAERDGGELLGPLGAGPRLADILPSSLEELVVQSGDRRLVGHLRNLGDSTMYGRKAFPKLENIVIELVNDLGRDDFHLDLDGINLEVVVVALNEREKRLDTWSYLRKAGF